MKSGKSTTQKLQRFTVNRCVVTCGCTAILTFLNVNDLTKNFFLKSGEANEETIAKPSVMLKRRRTKSIMPPSKSKAAQ